MKLNPRRRLIETSAGPVIFRLPTASDLKIAYRLRLPVLPQFAGKSAAEELTEEQAEALIAVSGEVVKLCSMSPRIVEDPDPENESEIGISEIPEGERITINAQLLSAAGFSRESAERVRPTSETPSASSPSTVSEVVTESVPQ